MNRYILTHGWQIQDNLLVTRMSEYQGRQPQSLNSASLGLSQTKLNGKGMVQYKIFLGYLKNQFHLTPVLAGLAFVYSSASIFCLTVLLTSEFIYKNIRVGRLYHLSIKYYMLSPCEKENIHNQKCHSTQLKQLYIII